MNGTLQYVDSCEAAADLDAPSSLALGNRWPMDTNVFGATRQPSKLLKYNDSVSPSELTGTGDLTGNFSSDIESTFEPQYVILEKAEQYEKQVQRVFELLIFESAAIGESSLVDFTKSPDIASRFLPDFQSIRAGIKSVITGTICVRKEIPQIPEKPELVSKHISHEVISQLKKEGLKQEVYVALEIAKKTFLTLHEVEVTIADDPEIPQRRMIRIELTVSGQPEQVLEDEHNFKQQLYSLLPLEVCERLVTTYKWKN